MIANTLILNKFNSEFIAFLFLCEKILNVASHTYFVTGGDRPVLS